VRQATAAGQEPVPTVPPPPEHRPENHFVEEVQRRLLQDPRLGTTERERRTRLLRGGLRIETTLDPVAQQRAQAAIAGNLPNQPPFTGALVAMDPATGAVRAMVGGPGFAESQYNIATQFPGRQPGSTWKIITLAAALEAGYSPEDNVDGTSPCTIAAPGAGMYTTQNAEGPGGNLTLRATTEESVNCAFARLIGSLGPAKAVDMAHRLGIAQDVPAFLSITLGTREATPLEMATVASTLAAGGVRHDPFFVTKVTARNGDVLLDNANAPGQQVISPDVAACETDMLRGVIANGTGKGGADRAHGGREDRDHRREDGRLVPRLHAAADDGRLVRGLHRAGARRGLRRPDPGFDLEVVHGNPSRGAARCSVPARRRSVRGAGPAHHARWTRAAAAAPPPPEAAPPPPDAPPPPREAAPPAADAPAPPPPPDAPRPDRGGGRGRGEGGGGGD
jgi:hypothetical protein